MKRREYMIERESFLASSFGLHPQKQNPKTTSLSHPTTSPSHPFLSVRQSIAWSLIKLLGLQIAMNQGGLDHTDHRLTT